MRASSELFVTGDSAYAVDHSGVIVTWNSAAEHTFGYPAAKALGRRCWELLDGQDPFGNHYCCRDCSLRERAFRREAIKTCDLCFKTAFNGPRQFNVTTLLVDDAPGKSLLLHLCRPEHEMSEVSNNIGCTIEPPTADHRRGILTEREKEVLASLSQGKSTRELASDMCISPATVRNHTQHILHKLNVHTRIAAISHARKLGLI